MENKKAPIQLYKEKKAEVHTHEEIKEAFDGNFAICFGFNEKRQISSKMTLFTKIWLQNPDAIITECDLCELTIEPKAYHNNYLIINKNGSRDASGAIAKLIGESGVVTSAYCFFSEKQAGVKSCYELTFENQERSPTYSANILSDGKHLLITARTPIKA